MGFGDRLLDYIEGAHITSYGHPFIPGPSANLHHVGSAHARMNACAITGRLYSCICCQIDAPSEQLLTVFCTIRHRRRPEAAQVVWPGRAAPRGRRWDARRGSGSRCRRGASERRRAAGFRAGDRRRDPHRRIRCPAAHPRQASPSFFWSGSFCRHRELRSTPACCLAPAMLLKGLFLRRGTAVYHKAGRRVIAHRAKVRVLVKDAQAAKTAFGSYVTPVAGDVSSAPAVAKVAPPFSLRCSSSTCWRTHVHVAGADAVATGA